MNKAEHENEDHEEALQHVERGVAAILSDEDLPEGSFQIIAILMGRPELYEFVLTQWHQKEGNWYSQQCTWLKQDATARLVQLLHSAGFGTSLRPV
jgi:hypothetical protein